MRKQLVTLSSVLVLTAGANANEVFSGRTLAMGGAGIAGGDYTVAAILNPANAIFTRDNDDFGTYLAVGAIANEQNDFLDAGDELQTQLDQFDGTLINAQSAQELSDRLSEFSEGGLSGEFGAQFSVAIPNRFASAVLYARQNLLLSAGFDYSDADRAYLENPTPGNFQESHLTSTASVSGYSIREVGIALGRSIATGNPDWQFSVGATPKHQTVETIEYTAVAGDYDSDDFDADTYTTEDTAFNLDIGASLAWRNTRFGLSARNLAERDYQTVDGNTVSINRLVTAGAAYNGETLTALLDLDLTTSEMPGLGDTRFARTGVELDIANWVQLRLGYRHDLEGTLEDTASVGFGLTPFDVLQLHVAAVKSSGDTLGAAVEFGLDI